MDLWSPRQAVVRQALHPESSSCFVPHQRDEIQPETAATKAKDRSGPGPSGGNRREEVPTSGSIAVFCSPGRTTRNGSIATEMFF